MSKLNYSLLIYVLLFFALPTQAQNSILDKKLTSKTGHFSLKTTLKQLSDQTGCVFSYDPTKIVDKQEIVITAKTSLTLKQALQKILPANVQYKTTGKYIVLLKTSNTVLKQPAKTEVPATKPTAKTTEQSHDSISPKTEPQPELAIVADSISKQKISTPKQDSSLVLVATKTDPERKELPRSMSDADSLTIIKPEKHLSVTRTELLFAANNHLAIMSTHIGLNNVYGIVSLASDYYQSYHIGLGIGVQATLYKRLGASIDITRYSVVAGKTKRVNVKAYSTEISPALNYRIGDRLKVILGPTAYLIRSKYSYGNTTTSLGRFIGYSAMLGVSYNFSGN